MGTIVEDGPASDALRTPAHPYTAALRAAMLVPGVTTRTSAGASPAILGDAPDPLDPPPGCRFHTRCPYVVERCMIDDPAVTVLSARHSVRCHMPLGGGPSSR
jgi:oligopeptide/dipeptide ABC transporter ATP-binding protein